MVNSVWVCVVRFQFSLVIYSSDDLFSLHVMGVFLYLKNLAVCVRARACVRACVCCMDSYPFFII